MKTTEGVKLKKPSTSNLPLGRKRTEYSVVPEVLVWYAPRIVRSRPTGGRPGKVRSEIGFEQVAEVQGERYELRSVVVHSGQSKEQGHYFSYSRSHHAEHARGSHRRQWYKCGDRSISATTWKNVREGALCDGVLFFYQRSRAARQPLAEVLAAAPAAAGVDSSTEEPAGSGAVSGTPVKRSSKRLAGVTPNPKPYPPGVSPFHAAQKAAATYPIDTPSPLQDWYDHAPTEHP